MVLSEEHGPASRPWQNPQKSSIFKWRLVLHPVHALIFFLCLSAAAWPALKNGYETGLGIGYRKDQMTFAISQGGSLLYKESDHDLKGVLLDAYFDARMWGILFSNHIDGGWYVSGRTHDISEVGVTGYPGTRSSFHENAGGFFADAQTDLGLVFDYTKRRGGFQIIPKGGYCVYYQQLKRGFAHPELFVISNTATVSCDLSHTRLEREWWGPLVGGDLVYKMLRFWSFEAGYYYYFLHFKQTFDFFNDLSYVSPSAEFFIRSKSRADFDSVRGQSIHGKIAAQVAAAWKMNWRFEIIDFFTSQKKTSYSQKNQQVLPAPLYVSQKQSVPMRAGWHSFSSILEVEYFF